MDASAGEIRRHAEERLRQFLDADIAVVLLQELRNLAPAYERDQRDRVVRKRILLHKGDAHLLRKLVHAPFARNARGYERAHAGAAQLIDGYASFRERLDDTDMREAPRATSSQNETDRAARNKSREAADIFHHPRAHMVVGFEKPASESEMLRNVHVFSVGVKEQEFGQSTGSGLEGRHLERAHRHRPIRSRDKKYAIRLPQTLLRPGAERRIAAVKHDVVAGFEIVEPIRALFGRRGIENGCAQ